MINHAGVAPVQIVLEYAVPEDLGMDPQAPAASELLGWCSYVVGMLALRPDEVRLVATGHFVQSVRDRSTGEQAASYDTARGNGIVAGKTMFLPDGRIDVLMPAGFFRAGSDEGTEGALEREGLVKRTAAHEAQHVRMYQAGEHLELAGGEPFVRANFLAVAHEVVEEYRAEVAIAPALRGDERLYEVLGPVRAWGAGLTGAAVSYQGHLDVGRLFFEVGTVSSYAWKALAYAAAEQLVMGRELPDEVHQDALWHRIAGEYWPRLVETLARVQGPSVPTEVAAVRAVGEDLAELLQEWLEMVGFRTIDADGGGYGVWIVSNDVYGWQP